MSRQPIRQGRRCKEISPGGSADYGEKVNYSGPFGVHYRANASLEMRSTSRV